jgi:uncharacterized membrane protein
MVGSEVRGGSEFTLYSRRSNFLSAAGRLLVFGSLAVITLAISLGFAVQGAWPVVPFAGAECVALYLAYRWLKRHEGDYECVTIEAERVVVECSDAGRVSRDEFPRYWTRVVLEREAGGRLRVCLRSHGHAVQIGRWLSEEARRRAAQDLKRHISGDKWRTQN